MRKLDFVKSVEVVTGPMDSFLQCLMGAGTCRSVTAVLLFGDWDLFFIILQWSRVKEKKAQEKQRRRKIRTQWQGRKQRWKRI